MADSSKSDSHTFKVMPLATTVSIITRPGSINAGVTYYFTATVTGPANSAVTWKIECSGTTNCGSIDAGTYTAPAMVTQQTPVTVTATSVADISKSDSLTFILLPPIAVAINPARVEVPLGFSFPFFAEVESDLQYQGVTWSVNGVEGGDAANGTITLVTDPVRPSRLIGLYAAPASAPAGPITITATSKVDAGKSANATVTLIANPHPSFVGDFAFLLHGSYGNAMEASGGILTLDGTGHLTATVDLHSNAFGQYQLRAGLHMTGTYGFEGKDGGWANLSYSEAGQTVSMTFKFVLVSNTLAKVIAFDDSSGDIGTIEKQSADFASALEGRRVLMLNGYDPDGNFGYGETYPILGQFVGSAGSLTGVYDVVDQDWAAHQSHVLTGSSTIVNKTGVINFGIRAGTSLQASPDMFLYPVSGTRALALSKTAPVMIGWIDQQADLSYSNASLAGDWVYYYASSAAGFGAATLGRFTGDGLGTSAPGCQDWTGGSSTISPMCYSIDLKTHAITADGRGFAPAAQFVQPWPVVFYFIDADHGYFGTQYQLGEFYRRAAGPFDNSTLNGNYTAVFNGSHYYFLSGSADNQVGTAMLDGNGNITLTTSRSGAVGLVQGFTRTGTYAFDTGFYAPGERGIMSLGNDFQLLYYTVSPDKVFMIQIAYDDAAFGILQRSAFSTSP
jgi:hypothetical protein